MGSAQASKIRNVIATETTVRHQDNHAECAAMVALLQGDRRVFPEPLFVDTAP